MNDEFAAMQNQLEATRVALIAAQDDALRAQRGALDVVETEARRRDMAERALAAAREELLSCKDERDVSERTVRMLRREVEELRRDAEAGSKLSDDVEKLKARSAETITHLRAELDRAREALERLEKRYLQLRQAYSHVSDQFDVAAEQVLSLESSCRNLANETDECRRRTVVAEQTLHEYVMRFANMDGRVTLDGDVHGFAARVHEYFPALLSQVNSLAARKASRR